MAVPGRTFPPRAASLAATGASATWLAGWLLALGAFGAPAGAAGWLAALVGALVPLGPVWLAAALARRLAAQEAGAPPPPAASPPAVAPRRPAAARAPAPRRAAFRSVRTGGAADERAPGSTPTPAPKPTPAPTPTPAPAHPEPGAAPATDDLLRALHFPESAEDAEGVAALRRVLRSRASARLVQAAQDVLTLLAEDATYMDEVEVVPAPPASWRAVAAGGRRGAAPLGEIRGADVLARTEERLARDAIFRDAAHHFLRQFDGFLAGFAPAANDDALAALAATRTARAFVLLSRAAAGP